jgi:hypothetical protein
LNSFAAKTGLNQEPKGAALSEIQQGSQINPVYASGLTYRYITEMHHLFSAFSVALYIVRGPREITKPRIVPAAVPTATDKYLMPSTAP